MAALKEDSVLGDLEQLRKYSGLNQQQFWAAVGISQSGGSRYETGGRPLPKYIQALLRLVYVEKIDLSRVRREDIELVEYLRSEKPDTYTKLRRESRQWVTRRKTLT